MPLPAEVWGTMLFVVVAFWGVAGWALVRTLRQEDRKVELVETNRNDRIDTYSPEALSDLRRWVERNPDDPYAPDATAKYNACVETLRATDAHFYDWSDEEIARLETL
ncbi:hypothetical protein [Halegenticoccus tardaugens]|uniref:hypothetical protein n=1 Tax=Halegenticoccus tardaugens TaxID=2071624 RepID=UPI00100B4FE7|nr:hypothetical protein [Halegenticoccus tardaugens]